MLGSGTVEFPVGATACRVAPTRNHNTGAGHSVTGKVEVEPVTREADSAHQGHLNAGHGVTGPRME